MIVKYAIANVDPKVIAKHGQAMGLSGSVSQGFGFGEWGVEPTTFLEMSINPSDASMCDNFVRQILFTAREKCAYRIIDGVIGTLLFADGST